VRLPDARPQHEYPSFSSRRRFSRRWERVYVSRIGSQTSPATQLFERPVGFTGGVESPTNGMATLDGRQRGFETIGRVTYEEWQNRSWTEKVSEGAEAILNSQL
jgi:hypothetical protein